MVCNVILPGRMRYQPAYNLQMQLVDEIKNAPDAPRAYLVLLEHEPVLTLGRSADKNDLLASAEHLREKGIELHQVDRGGKITYHGPGQVVGYPIIPLAGDRRDVHKYLRSLERILIDVLGPFGIAAGRAKGYTGVWVGDEKIAAIGVGITRWITFHGFALNVNTDLDAFSLITPCGITDKGITSMKKLLGREVDQQAVCDAIIPAFQKEFHFEAMVRKNPPGPPQS